MFAHWIRSLAIFTLALVAAALLPASVAAQQGAPTDPGVNVAAGAPLAAPTPVGPRVASTDVVRWTPPNPFDVAEPPPQDRVHAGQNIAMMAVGGAGLVIGLAIGGDGGLIMATTGGVVALVGLYRYLR